MDTLAADLQQATDDLLDVPGARVYAATPPRRRGSTNSKLEGLQDPAPSSRSSPSAVAPQLAPKAVSEPIILAANALEPDGSRDDDSHERFTALSTRTLPLRPISSTLAAQGSDSPLRSSASTTSDFFRRATASPSHDGRAGHADVWLNERGERVVRGSVVGKLALAGKSDAASGLVRVDEHRKGQHSDDETGHGWYTASSTFNTLPSTSNISSTTFDPSQHGSQSRLHTPAFFIQSFPDATPGAASPQPSADGGAASTVEEHDALVEDESTSSPAIDVTPSVSPLPSSAARSFVPASKQTAADAQLSNVHSQTVLLHGNRRAERSHSPNVARQHRPIEDPSIFERATSLFTTQLDEAPRDGDDDMQRAEQSIQPPFDDDGRLQDSQDDDAEPLSPQSPSRDSASSLFSLPVTTTSSDNASASRRRPFHRTASTSSSAGSRHSRRSSNGGLTTGPGVLARDVRVRGWSQIGGSGSKTGSSKASRQGFVTFEIVLTTSQGLTIRAHRRYSAFVQLRAALLAEAPQHAAALPELPPKGDLQLLLHRFSAKHLEQRRLALSEWLQVVVLDRRWGGRRAWREWLVGKEGEGV